MVTLALVGIGEWGKRYLHTASHVPSCRIKYICSPHITSHRDISGQYIQVRDYRDLAGFTDIDGVIIATPPSTHYKIAKYFLEREWNVLVEKPFTTRYSDALSLEQTSKQHDAIVMVDHIYLYHPAITKMQSLLNSLGFILYIEGEDGNFGPFRRDTSPLWDWAPHDISLCLYLLGAMPESVQAWSAKTRRFGKLVDAMICIQLSFPKTRAFIKIGSLFPAKRRAFTVFGTKGALVFNDLDTKKLTLYRGQGYSRISYPSYDSTPPLNRVLREFVDCIKQKKRPISDIVNAIRSIKIIDAVEQSLRAGGQQTQIL